MEMISSECPGPGVEWNDDAVGALGLSPALSARLKAACGGTEVRDVVFHLPGSYTDRRARTTLRDFSPNAVNTFLVTVDSIVPPPRKSSPTIVEISDETGHGTIVLFNRKAAFRFTVGQRYLVSGHCGGMIGRPELQHPEVVVKEIEAAKMSGIDPTWPGVSGLSQHNLKTIIQSLVRRLPAEPEWLDHRLARKFGWCGFSEAVRRLQVPDEPPTDKIRQRVAYDEAFCRQLAFQIIKSASRKAPGRSMAGDGRLRAEALVRFGFPLTEHQSKALGEVLDDMSAPTQMLRLVQGDVGSGKTLVAVMAMLAAVESGAQAVLLAPTDLLVQQHYRTISRLSPVPVGILTGGMSAGERKACLKGVASGAIPILIGTHAVFQAAVSYHNLGLIVVDEMHRFGVEQRAALTAKGDRPDTLLMTATPIPRTVFLAEIGWMDCSIIKGKPAGRKPIRTTLHPVDQVPDVVAAVGRMVARGGRVYWVCPLVAENAELDLAAAEERYTKLRESFGDEVALVHGQQAPEARAAALDGFAKGRFKLLVSTTVIEVGVDVPEATVMVIEHAERFGAAQLHQLRGRIGRGNAASFCLLIHARSLGKPSFQRLKLLRDSDDGFFISEEDYRLRGGGDVMGTRQSGLPGYRLVSLDNDRELLDLAHRDAAHLLREDPDLSSTRGKAALRGLEVFGLSDVRRFLRAG